MMARIQQYHSQVSSQTGAPSPMSSPADFGAGVGDISAGLEKIGNEIEKTSDRIRVKEERDADLWRAKAVADGNVQWTQTLLEREQTAASGAPDHTKNLSTDFAKWKEEAIASAPTDLARKRLEIDLTRMQGTFVSKAMVFEAGSAAKAGIESARQTLGSYQNLVNMDPSRHAEALASGNEQIDALTAGSIDIATGKPRANGLPADAAVALKRTYASDLAYKMFEGRIDRATQSGQVNSVLSELKDERWMGTIDPNAYERLVGNATSAVKQIAAKNEQLSSTSFNTAIAVAETGNAVLRPNFEIVSDPARRSQYVKAWDNAIAIGDVARQAKTASPAELTAMSSSFQSGLSSSDPEKQYTAIKQQDMLARVVSSRNREIASDPAGYVTRNIPQADRAYKAMLSQNTPESQASYIAEMKAGQIRLGIPSDKVKLLTSDQVEQYASTVSKADRTPEGAENLHKMLVSTHRQYGTDANLVFRQLVGDKAISGHDVVLAGMSDPDQSRAAVDLAKFSARGEKELLKLLPAEEKTKSEVQREVMTALLPLTGTLSRSVSGVESATRIQDAASLLAIGNVATKGMSIQEAVKDAVGSVAMSKFNVVGSYRVPVRDHASGAPLDHYAISSGASMILRQAEKIDFAPPKSRAGLPGEVTKENSLASLKAFGSWETNENETGVTLRWQHGEAVRRADGKGVVGFTWKELSDAGADRYAVEVNVQGGP